MPTKRIHLILGILSFIIVVGAVASTLVIDESKKQNTANFDALASTVAKELSPQDYEELKIQLKDILQKQDPRASIDKLKEVSAKNPSVSRQCHEFIHELGHESYKKYNDIAETMKYMDDFCISGYTHGVLEEYFKNSTNIFTAVKSVCTQYPAETQKLWQCNHGIGHGLMYYTKNNLESALNYCETISTDFARSACANGVYMENFNADDKIHTSTFLKKDDLFYPCNQKFKYKSDCYMNAPIQYLKLNNYDFKAALDWCNGAESDYQTNCVYGAGSQAARRNIGKNDFLNRLCLKANKNYQLSCINGLVSTYIAYYNSTGQAQELCNTFSDSEKSYCKLFITNNMKI